MSRAAGGATGDAVRGAREGCGDEGGHGRQLHHLWLKKTGADVALMAEGTRVLAHCRVLRANSRYFCGEGVCDGEGCAVLRVMSDTVLMACD